MAVVFAVVFKTLNNPSLKLIFGIVLILVVHNPRPCVATAIISLVALYLIISDLTAGIPALGCQAVAVPLVAVVYQTPASVANNTCVLLPGKNIPQRTGISGNLDAEVPVISVQVFPASAERNTFCDP